eukprot:EC813405.1.p7 GENE.EC813405.1~~EC813405.1.p7  ORF type:complete len:57 (+),score=2.59 EC813405.1:391-561(+)
MCCVPAVLLAPPGSVASRAPASFPVDAPFFQCPCWRPSKGSVAGKKKKKKKKRAAA